MTLDSYRSWTSMSFLIQNMAPKTLWRLVIRLRSRHHNNRKQQLAHEQTPEKRSNQRDPHIPIYNEWLITSSYSNPIHNTLPSALQRQHRRNKCMSYCVLEFIWKWCLWLEVSNGQSQILHFSGVLSYGSIEKSIRSWLVDTCLGAIPGEGGGGGGGTNKRCWFVGSIR